MTPRAFLLTVRVVRAAGLDLSGIGVMWFGGPHQARQGDLAKIRAGNDRVIALAAKHPTSCPSPPSTPTTATPPWPNWPAWPPPA